MSDAQPAVAIDPTREPIVVVDDLHIIYRVYGSGGGRGNAATALMRVVKRENRPQMKEIHAVRGVSFIAYRGDAIGVVGTNGSGKSTLLKAIAGLLPPAKGGVYTDGQPSLLGVNAALMKDLTGSRNIILGCLAMGLTPEETKEKYDEIVKFADLKPGFIDYPMSTYSSGMGARLRFAIAAARTHDVMLIDEALATGDAKFKRRSKAKIDELRKDAGAVFLVAHNLDVIEETCNRVIWLDEGRIKMDGDPKEVLKAYTDATGK
ncbi:ABC transporter ATP-binding protein [Actinomadura rudentiformis]|uniref:ABC transporter ATP-binding protein n=1 Tax=Actinomadura rudentiformis TaxID=359158 RepID=A0A6H9YQ82_9ACTN|nr:ABC transporter ATP-binding protein [Actinomadura rudentiformis]KAB2342217.1 ABC transporter ATP-binding protein [Actinomadura rudentiformis]